ncbi:relaxin-3 receptor 1 [Pristis pectinata]|uniref:relaxin-3 receptor 1 n=1 Tax=Pristis pectinata TaxID=685728 RepID=UPI00223E6676|nr:relaxin-3 receptor 1 [Pristis pectinata]
MDDLTLNATVWIYNSTLMSGAQNCSLYEMELHGDGSPALRIIISITYSMVCAVGLVGNLLVLLLMKAKPGRSKSTICVFILNLAVTDFQFVLTLPFWAVDTALDFSWPFGDAMCKIIQSVTVMNMYAGVFFLTAMGIARYWSVASALKTRCNRLSCSVKWISVLLWAAAGLATLPTAVFSTVSTTAGEKLCLLDFPDDGQYWLALYHIQKIILAFILPMVTLSVCYLLLLRFLRKQHIGSHNPRRKSRVTRSITIIMLSFFLCWLPNHMITFWGVLVKLNVIPWDKTYYSMQTYAFPVTVCLAHTNSCLNPVLYCLMRREFRKSMKEIFWKISTPALTHKVAIRPFCSPVSREPTHVQAGIPLNIIESAHHSRDSDSNSRGENGPSNCTSEPKTN